MVVLVLDNQWRQDSLELAEKFNFAVIYEPVEDYYFIIEDGVLKVRNPRWGARFSICLDLQREIHRFQRQKRSFKKDLLCRALGYRGQENFKVIDGTLGLGKDAVHIISFGIRVLGFEINPVPFCLVREALARASREFSNEIAKHPDAVKEASSNHFIDPGEFMEIRLMDSLKGVLLFSEGVEALYLDPMFENTKNKSKPGKSMVFLRDVTHEICSVQRVITQALNRGIKRVVVKRSVNGDYLHGKPDFLYRGKLVRYDVYTGTP